MFIFQVFPPFKGRITFMLLFLQNFIVNFKVYSLILKNLFILFLLVSFLCDIICGIKNIFFLVTNLPKLIGLLRSMYLKSHKSLGYCY